MNGEHVAGDIARGMARPWKVLIIVSIAVFMALLDVTVVNIAFPAIQRAFPTASRAQLSWVINAYTVTFAALLIVAGRTADLAGRRRIFYLGLFTFAAGSVLSASAPVMPLLLAGRVVQAVGSAMLLPCSLAIVLTEFPRKQLPVAVGLWSAVAAVAAGVGPVVGAALVQNAGWRWIFIVNLPMAFLAWLLGRRLLTESHDPAASRSPDVLGAAMLGGGVASLALGLVQGREWGWLNWRIPTAFGLFVVLAWAFLVRSRRHPSAILDLSLFRSKAFAIANAASFVLAASVFAGLLNDVLFLTGGWRYSILTAGLAITPGPIAAAVSAVVGGRLVRRWGFQKVIFLGTSLLALSNCYLILRVGQTPSYIAQWLPASILAGWGVGFGFATLGTLAATSVPPARFAVGSAVLSTARQLGGAVGVASLIAILGTPDPEHILQVFDRSWTFLSVTAFAAGLVTLLLGSEKRAAQSLPRDTSASPTS